MGATASSPVDRSKYPFIPLGLHPDAIAGEARRSSPRILPPGTYHALHLHVPTQPDELALIPPSAVRVFFTYADGWCVGRDPGGDVGYFPGVCVGVVAAEVQVEKGDEEVVPNVPRRKESKAAGKAMAEYWRTVSGGAPALAKPSVSVKRKVDASQTRIGMPSAVPGTHKEAVVQGDAADDDAAVAADGGTRIAILSLPVTDGCDVQPVAAVVSD